jgi:hypothetical protein
MSMKVMSLDCKEAGLPTGTVGHRRVSRLDVILVHCDLGNFCVADSTMPATDPDGIAVERIQTGVRLEKRLVKVLKALAEHKDMTLGDLLEGICLHALEGKQPFSKQTLALVAQLKEIYGLRLEASASHHLRERKS